MMKMMMKLLVFSFLFLLLGDLRGFALYDFIQVWKILFCACVVVNVVILRCCLQ